MEWLHCIKTGELVAFSEQYLIDCVKQYYPDHLLGCIGGQAGSMGEFIHNFGMELRANFIRKVSA